MGNCTYSWYDPTTNKLIRNRKSAPEGYECLGNKKASEAFNSCDEKEWPLLYINRLGGMIRVQKLPPKIRHKLKKIGIVLECFDW